MFELLVSNQRITANISERTLYVNTGLGVDIYKIEEGDIVYSKSIKGSLISSRHFGS